MRCRHGKSELTSFGVGADWAIPLVGIRTRSLHINLLEDAERAYLK
jgi:hypothetical protein